MAGPIVVTVVPSGDGLVGSGGAAAGVIQSSEPDGTLPSKVHVAELPAGRYWTEPLMWGGPSEMG